MLHEEAQPALGPQRRSSPSYWAISLRRLLRKKIGVTCLAIILLMYGSGILAPLVTPYGHDELADDPVVAEIFPYQSIDPIDDGRTRKNHLALKKLGLNGTNVYRRDDPFWDIFLPPWGFM